MDPKMPSAVGQLSNHELLERVKHLAAFERQATASLIAHLAELDERERRSYLVPSGQLRLGIVTATRSGPSFGVSGTV